MTAIETGHQGTEVPQQVDRAHPLRVSRPTGVVVAAFSLVGLAVVAPWTRRGWLLLLDWAQGPHPSLPRSFWGLDGGNTAALPFGVLVYLADHAVGAATVSWLVIFVTFPIAGLGVARLVGGSSWANVGAGLVYSLSPLVYERIWAGQVAFLLGYALLPWFAWIVLVRRPNTLRWAVATGALLALLIGLAVHFAFIAGLLFVASFLLYKARHLKLFVAAGAITVVLSAYLFVGSLLQSPQQGVGRGDLVAFRMNGRGPLGIYGNVVGMYGFWRQEAPLPRDSVPGWPFILGALLLVAAFGMVTALQDPRRRRVALALSGTAIVGGILALGDQGPTGWLFLALFKHVPGFAVMREPQKFVALVALAYAYGFGVGCDRALQSYDSRRARLVMSVTLVLIPLSYNPCLFNGLWNRLHVSHYPSGWQEADKAVGTGPGKVLFLPWHQYMGFSFTDARTVAVPAAGAFHRDVIVNDNPELPTIDASTRSSRSRFIDFLTTHSGDVRHLGQLIAPLGVEFVALAKTTDWVGYDWLNKQVDLVLLVDTPEISIYRNTVARPAGWRASETVEVANWPSLIALANAGSSQDIAITVTTPGDGPVTPVVVPRAGSAAAPPLNKASSVRYKVPSGAGGTAVVPEAFATSWSAGSGKAHRGASGETLVPLSGVESAEITYRFWRVILTGYTVVCFGMALGIALLVRGSCRTSRCRRSR